MRFALGLLLLTGTLVSAQSNPKALPPVYGATVYCPLAGKGAMGVGWKELKDGKYYRCLETFDESLKPNGAAWVEVEKDGTMLPR